MTLQIIAAFVFGLVFIITLLVLAIVFPKPTPFQYSVFRIVLSLACAGIAAMIPGFINLELESTIGLILRAGGALAVFVLVYFFNPARLAIEAGSEETVEELSSSSQPQIIGDNSNLQSASAGDASIIVQAGRDAVLNIKKNPPNIKLVRVTVESDTTQRGLKQKINIILKNSGDTTVFLLNGYLLTDGSEELTNCNHIGMRYSLSQSDWTYDVNIDDDLPSFDGQHTIAPNEVINFDIIVGRKQGGLDITVYRCYLKFEFDEGDDLVSGPFYLMIAGPTVMDGGFLHRGPSSEEWGKCQVENIRRLDRIGYDHRPNIDESSRKYVEEVSPGIFD